MSGRERGLISGLYRSWKGHIVYAFGQLDHSETRQAGVHYVHVTGTKAGVTEWRPLQKWNSSPGEIEGLSRFTPCESMIEVRFCPIRSVLDLFREIYPTARVEVVWCDHHDVPGSCYYYPDLAIVALRTDCTIAEAVGVLIHELAHVVTGHEKDEHGEEFDAAHRLLRDKWTVRCRAMVNNLPGLRFIKETENSDTTTTTAPA